MMTNLITAAEIRSLGGHCWERAAFSLTGEVSKRFAGRGYDE
jgi:hypothetical protein